MNANPTAPAFLVVVHGIDIVDVQEYARLLDPATKAHLNTTFTAQELEECGDNERTAQRLAGRFATKEAVLKALSLPFGDGVAFLDVEILTNETGAPAIITARKVLERALHLGIQSWLVSTSHTSTTAIASVIGVRAPVIQ